MSVFIPGRKVNLEPPERIKEGWNQTSKSFGVWCRDFDIINDFSPLILNIELETRTLVYIHKESPLLSISINNILCIQQNICDNTQFTIYMDNGINFPLDHKFHNKSDALQMIKLINRLCSQQVKYFTEPLRLMSSVCKKKGKLLWSERHLVLIPGRIFVFRNSDESFYPLNVIWILPDTTAEATPNDYLGITITTPFRTYEFEFRNLEERTRWLIIINEQLNLLRAVPDLCSLDTNTLVNSVDSLAGAFNSDVNPTNLTVIKQLAAMTHRKSVSRPSESILQSLKIIKDQRRKDSLRPSINTLVASSSASRTRTASAHHRDRNSRSSINFDYSNSYYLSPSMVIDYAQNSDLKLATDSNMSVDVADICIKPTSRLIAPSIVNSSDKEVDASFANNLDVSLAIDTTCLVSDSISELKSPTNDNNDTELKFTSPLSPRGVLIVNKKAGPPLPPRRNSIANAAAVLSPKNTGASSKNIEHSPKNSSSTSPNKCNSNQKFFSKIVIEKDNCSELNKPLLAPLNSGIFVNQNSNSDSFPSEDIVSESDLNDKEISNMESSILNVSLKPFEHRRSSVTDINSKPLAPPIHDSRRRSRNYFDPERKNSIVLISDLHSKPDFHNNSDLHFKPKSAFEDESLNSPKNDILQSSLKTPSSFHAASEDIVTDVPKIISGKFSAFLPKISQKISVYDGTILLSNQTDFSNLQINCLADSRKITYKFKMLTLGSLDFKNDQEFLLSKLFDIRKRIDMELDSIPINYLFVINGTLINTDLEMIISSKLSLPLVICPIDFSPSVGLSASPNIAACVTFCNPPLLVLSKSTTWVNTICEDFHNINRPRIAVLKLDQSIIKLEVRHYIITPETAKIELIPKKPLEEVSAKASRTKAGTKVKISMSKAPSAIIEKIPETPAPDFIVIPKSSPKNSPPPLPSRDLSGNTKLYNDFKIPAVVLLSEASKFTPKNISKLSSDNSILSPKFFSFIDSTKTIKPALSTQIDEPILPSVLDSVVDEPMSLEELASPSKETQSFNEYKSQDMDRRLSIPLPSEGGIRSKIARITDQTRPVTKATTVPKLYIKEDSHCPLMLCVMIESSQEALCYLYIDSETTLWDVRKFLCTSAIVRGNVPTGFIFVHSDAPVGARTEKTLFPTEYLPVIFLRSATLKIGLIRNIIDIDIEDSPSLPPTPTMNAPLPPPNPSGIVFESSLKKSTEDIKFNSELYSKTIECSPTISTFSPRMSPRSEVASPRQDNKIRLDIMLWTATFVKPLGFLLLEDSSIFLPEIRKKIYEELDEFLLPKDFLFMMQQTEISRSQEAVFRASVFVPTIAIKSLDTPKTITVSPTLSSRSKEITIVLVKSVGLPQPIGQLEILKPNEVTLSDIRLQIINELDKVPSNFHFMIDNFPVGLRQENKRLISDLSVGPLYIHTLDNEVEISPIRPNVINSSTISEATKQTIKTLHDSLQKYGTHLESDPMVVLKPGEYKKRNSGASIELK